MTLKDALKNNFFDKMVNFPQNIDSVCPICKTSTVEPCMLVAIDGTRDGNNEEACLIHGSCFIRACENCRINYEHGIIYFRYKKEK